jgi:phosphatidylserine/phosphatidylglycerophosphate/cardiolipin synthase-like enzyme
LASGRGAWYSRAHALRFFRMPRARRSHAPGPETRVDLRYVHPSERLIGDNRVTLLRSGVETYPAMLNAIRCAQRRVHLETYILRSDKTGEQFKQALIERAQAGVRVRLMFDSVGSFGLVSNEYLQELAAAGVDIIEYRPVTPWRRKLIGRLRALRASVDMRRGRPPKAAMSREPGSGA